MNTNRQTDYGTGQKKLSIYIVGLIICSVLTLISFWTIMSDRFTKLDMIVIIYVSAIIQFFTQLICFLRLNMQTEESRLNVMSFIFTGVILLCVVIGSIWIMWNLNANLM